MIFVINQRGIAGQVATMAEAQRLKSIHGWTIALGYPDSPSVTWKMAGDSAEAHSERERGTAATDQRTR